MIMRLFSKIKARGFEQDRRNGYNYAAGQLLKHGETIVSKLEDESSCLFDRTSFDIGVWDALHDFERKEAAK